MSSMTKLHTLRLGGNSFRKAPEVVWELSSLQVLRLEKNSISVCPEGFQSLPQLRELHLYRNSFDVPESIGALTRRVMHDFSGRAFSEKQAILRKERSLPRLRYIWEEVFLFLCFFITLLLLIAAVTLCLGDLYGWLSSGTEGSIFEQASAGTGYSFLGLSSLCLLQYSPEEGYHFLFGASWQLIVVTILGYFVLSFPVQRDIQPLAQMYLSLEGGLCLVSREVRVLGPGE